MTSADIHGFTRTGIRNYTDKLKIISVVICVFLISGYQCISASALARTPQITSNPNSFSFVVFGDVQEGHKTFIDLVDKVNQEEAVDFAVIVGDMAEYGREESYKNFLKILSNLKVKYYPVPGNHDLVKYGYKYYQKYFGPYYYSFDYKNSHFVVLNNALNSSFHKKQFNWLKKDLAQTKKENIFVFMHRPMFDPTEIYDDYIMSGRETVKELMKLFNKYKVDYVFAGHLHAYANAKRDNVIYVVTGGAGAQLHLPYYFGGFHHYVKINVDGNEIKEEVVKIYD